MIRLSMTYPSLALLAPVQLDVGLPSGVMASEPPWPVVWALHPAMSGGGVFFEEFGATALVDKYGLALVAPTLGNGYYCNSDCQNQADFLDELRDALPQILPLARDRAASAALGISMGAFGAVRWALASGAFARVAGISGAYDPRLEDDPRLFKVRAQKSLHRSFRPIMSARLNHGGVLRPENDINAMLASGKGADTEISLYCGEGDYISLNQTEALAQMCQKCSVSCETYISVGAHDLDYWRGALTEAILRLVRA